jgi:putative ATP-dependent endonuclease of the OLD family
MAKLRLSTIEISSFRSIEKADLAQCGSLNVLIGRNNSGKSNILSAIQLFFDFFKSSNLVATSQPPISEGTNWFRRDRAKPIVISGVLQLADAEMAAIVDAISNEAPQMRNALGGMSGATSIECQLTFYGDPLLTGYISHMSFGGKESDPAHMIFSLGRDAAEEIAKRDETARGLRTQQQEIERFVLQSESEVWNYLRDRPSARIGSSRPRATFGLSDEVLVSITGMARVAETYDDFRDRISSFTSELRGKVSTLLSAESEIKFETFSGESTIVPKYVKTIVGLIAGLKVHHLSEQRKPIGPEEADRILRLKTSRGQGQVLRDLQGTVAELLGVQIDAFSSDLDESQRRRASAELDVDDFLVQANGSGIREALRLILDFEFERPDILLLEEPEVHLHPALEIAMMQYLRKISERCQIFLTTHSTNFLDIADLRNVYLIKKNGTTHAQLLNVEEAEEAIPQELGIRLSSLFMYDRLVFVEGPSDEQVLRAFASTLGLNLSRTGVGFVTTGGARNFTHYANAATLAFLSKRRVKLHFVLDRDEKDMPEIEKLKHQLGDLGDLRVLARRELENYLLAPDAIAKYMAARLGQDVSPEEVGSKINEAADELLSTVAERRVLSLACKPIFPDRQAVLDRGSADFIDSLQWELAEAVKRIGELKEAVPQMLSEAQEGLQKNSLTDKLSVVPGEEILVTVFSKFGLKFSKRKDGSKIAAEMSHQEILPEIVDLLKKFTS